MKRIFVAIDISDEARGKVSDYIETLRNEFRHLRVGWEKDEKLHLTLKFLGDIDDYQLEKLTNAVQKTNKKISNFKLQISETGVFPNERKGRILWLDLKDETGNLLKLNKQLEEECLKIGFPKEKRNFKPHLTIARLREPLKSKGLITKHLQNEFEPVEFEVSEIVILESKLKPTGSIYSVVLKFKFGN
jgi:2'-5' RNA ligase